MYDDPTLSALANLVRYNNQLMNMYVKGNPTFASMLKLTEDEFKTDQEPVLSSLAEKSKTVETELRLRSVLEKLSQEC